MSKNVTSQDLESVISRYLENPKSFNLQTGSSILSFHTWSFTQGFIIGQLSVIVVLIFFLRFFIFSDARSPNPTHSLSIFSKISQNSSIIKLGGKERVNDVTDEQDTDSSKQLNSILEKTYYDVDTHQPESLDWFNVLIAQTLHQFREEALSKDNIVHSLNSFIQRKYEELPDFIDSIKVTELDIGDDFPIFSNCRIQYSPSSNKKRLEAKIDIDLSDRLAIGVETKLLMNFPQPFTAALPIELTVSIVRFQACLTVSLTNGEEFVPADVEDDLEDKNAASDKSHKKDANASDDHDSVKDDITANHNDDGDNADANDNDNADENNTNNSYYLMFSFSPEYKMEFDIQSLIGARSKLENIPKIASVIEYQIKKWFVERCVEPRFQFIKLPSLWPRSKNTRQEVPDFSDTDVSSLTSK
ncbi:related to Maintenance of mitochondrial morphology protein 1 [Saccharomycodes ludwigii]|uniref:Maintenance of mitochondrial morphology protein 1 n=1 Tax=Saccharomycodes ludwigii TaxID=36035 RepID=A0A376B5T9_9ASCO|nr:hypothetical protein SCDLUD_004840 [Saccharomycodes ludwigii]KAH3899397.1 hypothetical protein SCDLUD_004840 [Saccharomycodes ludwigii]SSD60058.1 related to Maintenance of mitochondrial morphology protein 1 [Saccharomycodes ludwigii]